MRLLRKEELNEVQPKFRSAVLQAWERGEEVPYGVVHLSSAPLTETDIAWAKSLILDETIL